MAEARASFLKPIIHHLVTGTTGGAPRKPERSRAAVAGGMVGLLPIQGLRVEQQTMTSFSAVEESYIATRSMTT